MTKQHVTRLYERLDRIVEDHYGTTDDDIVMFVIEANPGLEQQPLVLPLGLIINLPPLPVKASQPQVVKQIYLWT